MNLLCEIHTEVLEAIEKKKKIKCINLTDSQLFGLGRELSKEVEESGLLFGIPIKLGDEKNLIEFEQSDPINPLCACYTDFKNEFQRNAILRACENHPFDYRWNCRPKCKPLFHLQVVWFNTLGEDTLIFHINGEIELSKKCDNLGYKKISFERAMETLINTPVEKELEKKNIRVVATSPDFNDGLTGAVRRKENYRLGLREFITSELGKMENRIRKELKEFENNLPQSKEEELRFIALTPTCETPNKKRGIFFREEWGFRLFEK